MNALSGTCDTFRTDGYRMKQLHLLFYKKIRLREWKMLWWGEAPYIFFSFNEIIQKQFVLQKEIRYENKCKKICFFC